MRTHQAQLAPIQQLPLDLFPTLQPDGRRQRQGKVDVETGGLSLGTDDLYFNCIFCLHVCKIPYRVLVGQTVKPRLPPRTNPCSLPTWARAKSWPISPAAPSPPMPARCCCA